MSIEIRPELCTGCGACATVCPGSLIKVGSPAQNPIADKSDADNPSLDKPTARKPLAIIPKPERCWGCASCVKECPNEAISLYLGEDMGGLGARMSARRENSLLHWTVKKPDGSSRTITVNSRDSNRY